MTLEAYVDESKVGGLTLFVALVDHRKVAAARSRALTMRLKGNRRFHAKKERAARISYGIEVLAELGLRIRVYDARRLGEGPAARQAALEALVQDLAAQEVSRIILECDESLIGQDRKWLYRMVREVAKAEGDLIEYRHLAAHQEPLLWPSDLAGWCWFKKDWKAKVTPHVEAIVVV